MDRELCGVALGVVVYHEQFATASEVMPRRLGLAIALVGVTLLARIQHDDRVGPAQTWDRPLSVDALRRDPTCRGEQIRERAQ